MSITYKDINELSQKAAMAGTEKLPVSDDEFITPEQITADCLTESDGEETGVLDIDNAPTKNSNNLPKSGGVYGAIHPDIVSHGTSDTTFALTPNVLHTWGTVSALTLTLATPADGSIENEYKFRFQSGSTPTTLGLPNTVIFDDKKGDLIPEANHIYEVSIVDNSAVWAGWEVSNE